MFAGRGGISVAVMMAVAGCSGASGDELARDQAGEDAGRDAGVDAGRAAGPDSGAPDSDPDGGAPDSELDGGALEAGAGSDGGEDATAPVCQADGVSCAQGDGAGICCAGACVSGECCSASDCGQGDGSGFLCTEQRECVDVAASLSGLTWALPCTGEAGAQSCYTDPSQTVSATLGGAAGVTYDVTLRFRGVVEQKTYDKGCAGAGSGLWVSGGAPANDSYNIYRLEVSSPAQTFYLNAGASNITHTFALDFQQSIRMNAGASITLYAASLDNQQIKNLQDPSTGTEGAPIVVEGTALAQPYDGQFIQMDVLDVRPDAVQASGGGAAGQVLRLNGGQFATVARAPSLEPSDVSLESWFLLSDAPSGYGALVGKPYLTGTEDSYVLWFQSNVLLAGANLSSPAGAASVPWSVDAQAWHHVALTVDHQASITTLYVDGVAVSCAPAPAQLSFDDHPLLIGADIDNGSLSGHWYGALDEVRVFSSARSPEQVWADMHTHELGPTQSLVGEWIFDGDQGQIARDSSGSSNDAVLGANDTEEASDPSFGSADL